MRYLKRKEINLEKWDFCIENCTKPLIYGLSWYLDAATEKKWDALIWGDYEAVLPLPWNRKLGFKQVYMPTLTQQFGPFFLSQMPDLGEILPVLTKKFIRSSLSLSYKTNSTNATARINQELNLNFNYKDLRKNFRRDRRNDLNKKKFTVEENSSINEFMNFFCESSKELIEKEKLSIKRLKSIIEASFNKKTGQFFYIKNQKEILSAIFTVQFSNRIFLLLSSTTKKGFKERANPYLINHIIDLNANKRLILDFEGSNIPGVQDYYTSFGAQKTTYYLHQQSKLP